ncbi:hypothetical protein DFJ74DRAFT_604789 [Hyaloraphidium curvatum]|nr:hypothetical protein DFJ74DRAFT_604789 [Hyaloraphidium curvatum]
MDAAAPPKQRRIWPWVLGGVLGAAAIAGIVAGAVVGTQNAKAASAVKTPTPTATATPTSSFIATPTPFPVSFANRTSHRLAVIGCLARYFPSSRIVDPSDPNFDALAEDFNSYWNAINEPLVIVLPVDPSEVGGAVLCARAVGPNTPIVPRSGGHSYEGYSLARDGIVVDLRRMSDVRVVNDAERIVDIGGGAWLGKVYYELLRSRGWVLPGGDCPSVGIGGHAQGGGFGVISRKWGLVVDTMVQVQMVDAAGKVVNASADENPELFWAVRGGGGGNFGIVTRFRAKAVPITPTVSSAVWSFPSANAVPAIDALVRTGWTWTENVTTTFYVDNQGSVSLTAFFSGPAADFPIAEIDASFPGLNATRSGPNEYNGTFAYLQMLYPDMSNFALLTDKRYVDSARMGWTNDNYFKAKSFYFAQPSFGTSQGSAALLDGLRAAPDPIRQATWFQLDSYGGRIATCGAPGYPIYTANASQCQQSTAFVHRAPDLVNVQMYTSWNNDSFSSLALDYMRAWGDRVAPWSTGLAYQNYIDNDLGTNLTAYYGGALPALGQVKGRWDPSNVFRFAQSIPPST